LDHRSRASFVPGQAGLSTAFRLIERPKLRPRLASAAPEFLFCQRKRRARPERDLRQSGRCGVREDCASSAMSETLRSHSSLVRKPENETRMMPSCRPGRSHRSCNVESIVVPAAGHYIADEQPDALAALIEVRAGQPAGRLNSKVIISLARCGVRSASGQWNSKNRPSRTYGPAKIS
jgi:hypothetical protein